jgi:NADH-quinone oxidoreductase subunit L
MTGFILFLYLVPLLSCLLLASPYRFKEHFITRLTSLSLFIPATTTLIIVIVEVFNGNFPNEYRALSLNLYGHAFDLIILMDINSAIMLFLTHILGLLVVKYSHGYLHLEKGFQRFFSTILFFIFGMYLISGAGTMDLFFAGWEIVGMSSFFLIAFYRAHTRSVTNAWRIYNIYRVCDVGLLLSAVLGHILWHEATKFSEIASLTAVDFAHFSPGMLVFLNLFLIFASLGKSAQFPFHNWPSRAMEGPTPSSAIFYGALSIHAGVFLLVRTYPLWSHTWETRMIVGAIGLVTLVLSTLQGRVQPTIKGQIAYAATAQIGVMFFELSLGLVELTMVHLFFHALYRCFQLLVSPSIVASSVGLTNKVTLERIAKSQRWELKFLPKRLNATLYTLSMNDFGMDTSWRGFNFIPWRHAYWFILRALGSPLLVLPLIMLISPLPAMFGKDDFISVATLSIIMTSLSLFFSMRALLWHHNAFKSMIELGLSLFIDMMGVYIMDSHSLTSITIYMSSVAPCLLIAMFITHKFQGHDLRIFHALGTNYPNYANLFLICFMVIAGMPISGAFLGEDILLEEVIEHSHTMAIFTSLSLMLNGLICVRIYIKLFMGRPSGLAVPRPEINKD